jgi:serine/threonine protein kinase
MIGQMIAHYRILEKLGEGGMGVVYKAVDTALDRFVALKFLPPDLIRDPKARARFVHEAKAASALDHPNLCTIYEINETVEGGLFIAMSCYEGETLKEKVARGPLKLEEAIDIAQQIAQGLSKAHQEEIIHRDIKPGNVFLTADAHDADRNRGGDHHLHVPGTGCGRAGGSADRHLVIWRAVLRDDQRTTPLQRRPGTDGPSFDPQ